MSDEVKLEEEWAREKAAKQEAGRKPPPSPKSRKGLIVALVGVGVIGAMIAVVLYAGDEPAKPTSDSSGSSVVKLEIRSAPKALLTVDGNSVGHTPKALQFAKSAKEIVIEATMQRHLIGRLGAKEEKWVATRKVKLDRDQLIDFSIKEAKLVESNVTRPDVPEE